MKKIFPKLAAILMIAISSTILLTSTSFADTTIDNLLPRPGEGKSPGAEDITDKFNEQLSLWL
ncbi:hypothetical protein HZC20_02095 [Candidatus Peregrinibacteria bacterium]|nr:hypothetical protein [Candidatus Peregrinibacteria bacterium]